MGIRKQAALLFLILAVDIGLAAGAGLLWRRYNGNHDPGFFPVSGREAVLEPKTVALTFDDGPHKQYTRMLLDGLKERDVKASFFLVGECIDGNEDLVRRMAAEGHLTGVHCLHHTDLTREEPSIAVDSLEKTRQKIREAAGRNPEYVRPPYGKWSGGLEETVDMVPVFWNVDSLDWKLQNTEKIVRRVLKDTEDGSIILMHDEFPTSVEAALEIIDNLQAKGYTFVTVDELSVD